MKQVKKVLYVMGAILAPVVLIFLFTLIVMLIMMGTSEKLGFAIPEDMLYHMSGGLGTLLAALVCVWHVKRKKYCACVQTQEKLNIGNAICIMVLAASCCNILWSGLTSPILSWLLPQAQQEVTISASVDWVNIVCAVLIAPVGEELLFRKGIYNMFCQKMSKVASVILCSLVFALLHGYQLEGFLSCLVGGVAFTLIYDKTGNVGYSILAHMACNICATVTNALERANVTWFGLPVQYEMNGYNMYHVGVIILAALLCGICFMISYRKRTMGAIPQTN